MGEEELSLLMKSMSEILDNQLSIMKHLGIIHTDSELGDGCDGVRELSSKLYNAGVSHEPTYYY